jgi:type I restriction enzyme, S subunit
MSWPIRRIGDFTNIVTKGTTPTKSQGFSEHGINYIKAEALNGDVSLDITGGFFITEDVHQKLKRSILEEGDVLLTIAGVNIGRCGIIEERHLPANTNQAVGIMRVDRKQVYPLFLYYWFKQSRTFRYVQSLNAQAAQPNINLAMLKNIEVPIPKRPIQESIVNILSAYDDLIENNRRRIQLLEQAARLLYKEWFVHLRFPGHEHTKIINGIPERWNYGNIGDLGEVVTGKTPSKKKESNFGGNIPFIKTPDMHGNTIVIGTEENLSEEGAHSQENKTLPARSILVSCIGTVGITALNASPAQTNQQINAIVPKSDSLRYWTFFMASNLKSLLEGMGGGATMANVNKSKFAAIPVIIPSRFILEQFNDVVIPIINQIEQFSLMNAKLVQARDLLLPRLMNGEIAV